MPLLRWTFCLVIVAVVSACPAATGGATGGGAGGSGGGAAGGAGGGAAGGVGGGGAAGGGGGTAGGPGGGAAATDGGILGVELLAKLPGLWSGPAMMTPLGNFPMMNFDLRPTDGQFVFGQVELDNTNTLRFGFSIETYGGRDQLAYRNGGYFGGTLRDSRTALVETDGGTYRFCYVGDGGCSYIDARFTVAGDSLVLDTKVKAQPHVYWNAVRQETRAAPSPFPTTLTSRGDGSAPWPPLATVTVNATFPAIAATADVWIILTTTTCFPTFQCHDSRSLMTTVAANATGATLSLPNVHPGDYKVTVLLDLDRNFSSTRAPSTGDKIAIDQPLTVPASGTATLNASTSFTVP